VPLIQLSTASDRASVAETAQHCHKDAQNAYPFVRRKLY